MHVEEVIFLKLQIARIQKKRFNFFVFKRIQLLSIEEANILLR